MSHILTDEIKLWIQKSIDNENCTITIENTTQKGEGYGGDFIFAKVDVHEPSKADKVIYVALKRNNQSPVVQKQFPLMNELCKREVYFYGSIIPAFQKFYSSKRLQESLNIVPKCHKAFLDDENNVIVLENLKKEGYVLFPREKTMNSAHIELCLRTYAKLHAISFAMKDQNPEAFKNISETAGPMMVETFKRFQPVFDKKSSAIVNTLKEAGREDLSLKYEKFITETSIFNRFVEAAESTADETVIIHGDCHNANMLFLYKDNDDNSNPEHVALIDFQITCLHSPIIDITCFLQLNLSTEGFNKFNYYLEYYYNQLSTYVKQLGSDINILFPKHLMKEHLKKFLPYGFCIATSFLEMLYIDNEDAPALIDEETNELMGGLRNLKLKSRGEYLVRLASIVENFFISGYM